VTSWPPSATSPDVRARISSKRRSRGRGQIAAGFAAAHTRTSRQSVVSPAQPIGGGGLRGRIQAARSSTWDVLRSTGGFAGDPAVAHQRAPLASITSA
jgi:hypothetical protein